MWRKRAKKIAKLLFLSYLLVGTLLIVSDTYYKHLNRERYLYLDVELWKGNTIKLGRIEGETQIEKAKEAFRELRSIKRVVWFRFPDLVFPCPLKVWDALEKESYELCKDKSGKWYAVLPGSYKGRSTSRYFEVSESEALKLIRKIEEMTASQISLP